ncbi:MAG: ferredoxin family protein [Methanobrevibacter sp.]|nr:ferredoxin family protein [Methanobrevibacter sp.]
MIKIDSELCKGCDICIEFCPKDVFIRSSKANKKGVYLPIFENEEKCNKCHLCELSCPDQAVTVYGEDTNDVNNTSEANDTSVEE